MYGRRAEAGNRAGWKSRGGGRGMEKGLQFQRVLPRDEVLKSSRDIVAGLIQ